MWSRDVYRFKVDDHAYTVSFLQGVSNEFVFADAPNDIPKQFDYVTLELDYEGDEITGTGNAYKVFSTVLDIIKKHKRKVGVPILAQSKGDVPSRVKLYSRMFDKIASHKWETKLSKDDFKKAGFQSDDLHLINWMI